MTSVNVEQHLKKDEFGAKKLPGHSDLAHTSGTLSETCTGENLAWPKAA